MNDLTLPADLLSVVGTEKVDFSVVAKRSQPAKNLRGIIFFGIIWTAFTAFFIILFFGPLFLGKEVHIRINGTPITASWENFRPLVKPALITGLFLLIGLAILAAGFYSLYQKGGYFVGTNNRLIRYLKGKIDTYDWEQFSGSMEINASKGDISLQLRTGRMRSREDRPDEYVPDMVYISGIPNVMEIEHICRCRIKGNDPTPSHLQ